MYQIICVHDVFGQSVAPQASENTVHRQKGYHRGHYTIDSTWKERGLVSVSLTLPRFLKLRETPSPMPVPITNREAYMYPGTSWFKHIAPSFVCHECRMQ